VRRTQLSHAANDRCRCRNVLVGHEVVDGAEVEFAIDHLTGHDRFELRPEDDAMRSVEYVQRLDTQSIPGQQQTTTTDVKDGESEHSVQAVEALLPPLLESTKDDLGIRGGSKVVPESEQFFPQRGVTVDLAIEHDNDGPIFVAHRLLPGCRVYDGESAHAQSYWTVDPPSFVVWSAMHQRAGHSADDLGFDDSV
jgi:hypothetical protein